jgi:hypothetical protein
MTEQTNKITMEEVFGDFNYDDVKDYKNNHLCIDVGIYDESLDDECDEFDDWYDERFHFENEEEFIEVKKIVIDNINGDIESIYNNEEFAMEQISEIINEIKNDFNEKTEAYEDYETIDCFKIYIKVYSAAHDEENNFMNEFEYIKYIDIFENDKDIITLPVKNAKKTK